MDYEKGLLSGKGKLVKFIKNISQDFLRRSPRYDQFTKQLYECIRIIGGPRTSRVLASNLEGPSNNTQRRHKREHQFDYYPDRVSERVFENLAKVYNKIRANKKINGDVLVETAEDETVIISKCEWDVKSDQVWGWCGREEENHFCDAAFVHIAGDGDDAYARLVDAYRQNRVAGFAGVVILLQAVYNKFDHQMVENQWNEIKRLYYRHLLPVIGPLVGHASDGDSRRRKLHLANSTSNAGERYRIDHQKFICSGKLVEKEGKHFVEDLSDQDFVHNGKKLVNHLMHPSRVLSLGENLVHIYLVHLQLLIYNESLNIFDHGLQQNDVDRPDRMNWESAQRVLFPKVRECLSRINAGVILPQENVCGTVAYLNMAWRYVEIFYSLSLSLIQRITNALYVCNFLQIWRLWVYRTGNLALQHNFISTETFQDVSLLCHQCYVVHKSLQRLCTTASCLLRSSGQ